MSDHDDELVDLLRGDYARLPASTEPVDVDGVTHRARRTRRRRRVRLAGVVGGVASVAAVAGLAGPALLDGSGRGIDADLPPAATPYDGPLDAPGRYGAAGRAIDCVHPPTGANNAADVYEGGATSDSPLAAVDTAYSEGLFLAAPPDLDLALAASEGDRRLLTHEVDGRVLIALVVRDGPATEGAGGDGWYVESWARCDFAEFPGDVEIPGIARYGAWTDTDGVPVPVAKVYTTPGSEHCGWQTMQFLVVDGDGRRSRLYVEAPDAELRPYVAGRYRADVPLPPDARDTGWERDDRHLWLSADSRFAYVGSRASVATWPRFDTACG